MAFPSSPTNGQIANRFGRKFQFNSTSGTWLPVQAVAASTLAETSINTLSDIDLQTTAPQDGETLVWNAAQSKFVPGAASGGGASVSVSETAPTEPSEGDQWFNSSTLKMYVYYSNQWIAASTAGPAGADATPTSYANLAAFPSSGNAVGNLAIALDTKALYVWDGSEWDRIYSGPQTSPEWVTQPNSAYSLTSGGSPVNITIEANDPDGFDITYGVDITPSNTTAIQPITQSGGTFTITPSTVIGPESIVARFKATDGINIITSLSTISVVAPEEGYVPSGTTLLLGLKFNNSTLTQTGTWAPVGIEGSLTYVTTGGVQNSGYMTGWSPSSQITISEISTTTMLNKTYVAWYKGTQTNTGGTYSPSVPIFSYPSGTVWSGLGLSGGKISIANGTQNIGTTNVATDDWVSLAWTISSTGLVSGFVNGIREVQDIQIDLSHLGPRIIGNGYAYADTANPTALDAIQVFDGVLTDSQILAIATGNT